MKLTCQNFYPRPLRPGFFLSCGEAGLAAITGKRMQASDSESRRERMAASDPESREAWVGSITGTTLRD